MFGKKDKDKNESGANSADQIYRPGVKVDFVIGIDSEHPIIRPTIIFEASKKTSTMVVSQTKPEVLLADRNKEVYLTTLVRKEFNVVERLGLRCEILDVIHNYPLLKKKVNAIQLEYFPPPKQVNIRTAYRLNNKKEYEIKSRVLYKGQKYMAGEDFTVKDISINGIGILIPRFRRGGSDSLSEAEIGEEVIAELTLLNFETNTYDYTFSVNFEIVRRQIFRTKPIVFIGAKFINLIQYDQEFIYRFIHSAQLHERSKKFEQDNFAIVDDD